MTSILLSFLVVCILSTSAQNKLLYNGTNLALNRPTELSAKVAFDGNANRAVDGNTNADYTHGSCTHTSETLTTSDACWTVTLVAYTYITGIKIFNRNSLQVRLQYFQVIGTNETQDEILYDDANKGAFNQSIIELPLDLNVTYKNITVKIPANNTGKGNAILTLCEVEVYGGICKRPVQTNHDNTRAAYAVDDVITFFCEPQYKLNENASIKCTSSGEWSGKIPVCKIVNCSYPGDIGNGLYMFHNDTYVSGNMSYNCPIYPLCDTGYTLDNAVTQRTCLEYGNWSGSNLNCQVSACQHPGNIKFGRYVLNNGTHYSNGVLNINDTITTKCDTGCNLTSGPLYRTCTASSNWSGDNAKCSPVTCSLAEGAVGSALQEAATVIVIVGVVGGVGAILTMTIVIGYVLYRKRRQSRRPSTKHYQQYGHNLENTDDRANAYANLSVVKDSLTDMQVIEPPRIAFDQTYYNVQIRESAAIPRTAIKIHDLSKFVFCGTDTDDVLKKEFESLPKGLQAPHTAAITNENKTKNKYKYIFPYDETRVILAKELDIHSNYINASYIHGANGTVTYVAAQGPIQATKNDFWRMVWQLDCGKIVMLTNLTEKHSVKCCQYWPLQGTEECGNITVTLLEAENLCDFAIRRLSLQKNSCKKLVTQYHFTTWPDKDVPKYASSLVHFRNKIRYSESNLKGPVIVHCSAGVGRTGVFIALDYLIDEANALQYVDVFGCVQKLREQRANLVQTERQYIFLHQALVESLSLSTSGIPASRFPEAYKDILQFDPRERKRGIDVEFEMIEKVSPKTEEFQYTSAKSLTHRKKNRYLNILPAEEYMPTLSTSGDANGRGYINAVLLPNYKVNGAFIITQSPLESTKEDFWNLVYEYEVFTVVMMNHISELKAKEIYWPPDDGNITYEQLEVSHLKSEEVKGDAIIEIQLSKFQKRRKLKLIQFGNWKGNEKVPRSPDDILRLLKLVQEWQQQTGNRPIVVHCMNGADKCGLFCVISAVTERLKIEKDVAITQIIQSMRRCREQIIPNVEQFQFCHDTVLAFLQLYETYSNFSST